MVNNEAFSKTMKILGIVVLVIGIGVLIYGIYVQATTYINYLAEYEEWARHWSDATNHLKPNMPMFTVYIPIGLIILFIGVCFVIASKMLVGNKFVGGKK